MTDTQTFIKDHGHDSDAELAAALVEHAGQLALRMRARGVDTDYKTSVSDVVTDADRAAEAFVAEVLDALDVQPMTDVAEIVAQALEVAVDAQVSAA